MNRTAAIVIRDLLNLVIYTGVLITVTIWIYKVSPDLEPLKNTLFPMNAAILLSIVAAIVFVFINRVTTLIATKLIGS